MQRLGVKIPLWSANLSKRPWVTGRLFIPMANGGTAMIKWRKDPRRSYVRSDNADCR